MRAYRVKDLKWSWSGDLFISDSGDLQSTQDGSLESFIQEVQTRVRSDLEDWEMTPHLGASLTELVGEPNEPKVAEEGKVRILSALTRDAFCDIGYIKIRYMPVSASQILYDIKIDLPDLEPEEEVQASLLFDTNENDVKFL
jgi:hypothetical protein